MKTFDIVMSFVVLFLIAKNLMATVNNSKVRIRGAISGQFIGNMILAAAVLGLILFKRSEFVYPWLYPVGMAIYVGSAFLVKSGMAEDGLIYSGKKVPFSEMEFYAIEQMGDKRFFLRIHGSTKEYIITFPIELQEEIQNRLNAAKVKLAERIDPRKEEKAQ